MRGPALCETGIPGSFVLASAGPRATLFKNFLSKVFTGGYS